MILGQFKYFCFQVYTSEEWASACSALWWPFEDNICFEMRCLTCYPAVIAAHTNCKTRFDCGMLNALQHFFEFQEKN